MAEDGKKGTPEPVQSGDSSAGSAAGSEKDSLEEAHRRLLAAAQSKEVDDKERTEAALGCLRAIVGNHPIADSYNVVYFHDDRQIMESDADAIYRSVRNVRDDRPILLIIHSNGGQISPAYFISKLCREFSRSSFQVVVPRRAKSAATLICCGADLIHMGHLSQLGPIDPQVDGIPALALKHAVEHIAELVSQYPGSAEMFAMYLGNQVNAQVLGLYERVASSSAQYAERLLNMRRGAPTAISSQEIAQRLVYEYKDHGFAIDANEVRQILGDKMISVESPEYKLGDAIYQEIGFVEFAFKLFGVERKISVRGVLDDGLFLYPASK